MNQRRFILCCVARPFPDETICSIHALDQVTLKVDKRGTGALIQTMVNNDSRFMIKVPDGQTYPGVKVSMSRMQAEGDIHNEDYQCDLYLSLTSAKLTGRIVSGTAIDCNLLASA